MNDQRIWLSLLLLFILAGCWDRVEVNDIGIVLAAAYDEVEDGQFLLSIEVPLVGGLGGPDGGGGGTGGNGPSYVDTAQGRTLREANGNIQRKMARELFYSHRRVIIVGEDLAQNGIYRLFDVVARVPENRLTTFMVISKGKAADILQSQPHLDRFSSEAIREIVVQQSLNINLKDIAQGLNQVGSDTILPYVEKVPVKGSEQEEILFSGYALFKDDQMKKVLTGQELQGILWLRQEFEPHDLTFISSEQSAISEAEQGVPRTVRINKRDTAIKPILDGDQLTYQVNIDVEANLLEDLGGDELLNKQVYQAVEEQMRKEIEESVELAIETMKEHKADVVNLGVIFSRYYPGLWRDKYKEIWYEQFEELHFEITVQAKLSRVGMIFQNVAGGLQENE